MIWFKEKAEAEIESYALELDSSGKRGILRMLLIGKSEEDPYRLDVELDGFIAKVKDSISNLIHVQVENRVENIKQTFHKPLGGQDAFLWESMKPLGDLIEKAMPIIEDVEMTLEEKASQRTGLLTKSDRQPFVEKWMETLKEKVRK